MIATPPRLLLLDFDGVLAQYRRPLRLAHLAAASGCDIAQVSRALFDAGLEAAYDGGELDTPTYLRRLGEGLGTALDEETWIAARVAACRADPRVLDQVAAVAAHTPIGVLTNNGALMERAIFRIVPPLFPALQGRVLCSGALGTRKPQADAYLRALRHFDVAPRHTLFVDDLFVNVRGARAAGLQADTVIDAASLRRVLKRYRLA